MKIKSFLIGANSWLVFLILIISISSYYYLFIYQDLQKHYENSFYTAISYSPPTENNIKISYTIPKYYAQFENQYIDISIQNLGNGLYKRSVKIHGRIGKEVKYNESLMEKTENRVYLFRDKLISELSDQEKDDLRNTGWVFMPLEQVVFF